MTTTQTKTTPTSWTRTGNGATTGYSIHAKLVGKATHAARQAHVHKTDRRKACGDMAKLFPFFERSFGLLQTAIHLFRFVEPEPQTTHKLPTN